MNLTPALLIVLAASASALAACGRPDASGVYLSKSDRAVALVQLAQAKDGAVSGRVEQLSVGPGGAVENRATPLQGAAADHALTFAPGVSGTFTRDALTLGGPGLTLAARRSSLQDYQKAVARLEAVAAAERRRASDSQAQQAAAAVSAAPIRGASDKAARLEAAAAELSKAAADLNAGVAAAPDFGRQSAEITARIAALAQNHGQAAAANALIVSANQIEVARGQYAVGLNPIVHRGARLASEVQQFCGSPEAAKLAPSCARATAAATEFQSAQVHAYTVFSGYRRQVQLDLARQNELARKLGG